MSNEPDAVEGFVSYEQNHDDPALKAPHEAEALAMSLLGAASEARAQQAQEKAYHERNLAVAAFVTAYRRAPNQPATWPNRRRDPEGFRRQLTRLRRRGRPL